MTYERAKFKIKKLTYYLEFVLALFIVASVILGMVDLIRYLILIFTTNPVDTYEILQKFLGHVLLLVVGIELVVMLVFHSPSSVIEVLLYAVARKLLIGNQGMIDFIIGIVAIAAIFAIRKFLFVENMSDSIDSRNIFSAATPTKYINELLDIEIPEEIGNTIGGVISHVAKNSCRSLVVGAEFDILNIKIRILKMKDGVIEKVSIRVHEG
ncbi:MAG: transporter associated domain-containing protein [Lutisporaceae bacterium]